jgi:hypothetical protein
MPKRSNPKSRAANMDDLLAWAETQKAEGSGDGSAASPDEGSDSDKPKGELELATPATPIARNNPPSLAPGDGDPCLDDEATSWRLRSTTRSWLLWAIQIAQEPQIITSSWGRSGLPAWPGI